MEIGGQKVAKGSAYNLLADELGAPGLLLWIGLSLSVIVLAARRLRRVPDVELRTYLVAILTAFIALTMQGVSGATLAVTVGAFLWFAPGVIAYWLAGAGWTAMRSDPVHGLPVHGLASAGRAGMDPNPVGAQ